MKSELISFFFISCRDGPVMIMIIFCRTSANIQNVGDVELTQMGSFTGEMDRSTLNRIPNVIYYILLISRLHCTVLLYTCIQMCCIIQHIVDNS